ncbi:hypothetical protein DH2020_018394 [Rehmannia glutinosa]|uniref:Non-haem dioxygenase N-terminal domain-containing protein n=1 Tax=Rehmannia glutinosa TaxID=99300 RepID=A0ABR0WIW0_REHGL
MKLINHGISEELLERVKKVALECYKMERGSNFKTSKPVQLLNGLIENKSDEKIVSIGKMFSCSEMRNDDQWPSKTPAFK